MLLLDKGYFDYDYEHVESALPEVNWEDTIKSDEEVNDILSIFGLGRKEKTEEELQQFIIKEEETRHGS